MFSHWCRGIILTDTTEYGGDFPGAPICEVVKKDELCGGERKAVLCQQVFSGCLFDVTGNLGGE